MNLVQVRFIFRSRISAERRKSPKSEKTKLGMVVSKSITHSTFPSLSNNMLDTFVSQWQIRFGSFPSRYRRSAAHISSASFSISSTSDCTFSIRPLHSVPQLHATAAYGIPYCGNQEWFPLTFQAGRPAWLQTHQTSHLPDTKIRELPLPVSVIPNEHTHTPVAFAIKIICFSFGSRYKAKHFAVYIRFMSLFQLFANMTGHTFNIVLKKFHILENLMIDTLQYIIASLRIFCLNFISLINQTAVKGIISPTFPTSGNCAIISLSDFMVSK